jgi:hypothetical protein
MEYDCTAELEGLVVVMEGNAYFGLRGERMEVSGFEFRLCSTGALQLEVS